MKKSRRNFLFAAALLLAGLGGSVCAEDAPQGKSTVLDAHTSQADTDKLLQDENAELDISGFDLARLPPVVKAKKLFTNAQTFNAPALQNLAGNIEAPRALSFDMPELRNVSGHIDLPAAAKINIPKLENVSDYLKAPAVTAFSAPVLQDSGAIDVRSAKSFNAPALEIATGNIDLRMSQNFDAPRLEIIRGYLNADSVPDFNAPKLKKVRGAIYAFTATHFAAPALKKVEGEIDARHAKKVETPALGFVGDTLYALAAESLTVSKYDEVLRYYTEKTGLMTCFPPAMNHDGSEISFCSDDGAPPDPEKTRCKKVIEDCGIQIPRPAADSKPGEEVRVTAQHKIVNNSCMMGCERFLHRLSRPKPPPPAEPCGGGREPIVSACPMHETPPLKVAPQGDNSL